MNVTIQEIDNLHKQLSVSNSLADYKKYAVAIISAEKSKVFKRVDDAIHQKAAGLILNPLLKYDVQSGQKLDELETLAGLLDVPPPHDSNLDRDKSWQKIIEIIDGL